MAALATYCAAAGIQAIVPLPRGKISIAQARATHSQLRVLYLDTDFDGCTAAGPGSDQGRTLYLANSMNSLRVEGQKTVGIEILQQFDWAIADVIIIPWCRATSPPLGKGLMMMKDLGLEIAAHCGGPGRARQPALPRLPTQLRGLRTNPGQKASVMTAIQRNPVSYQKASAR